MEAQKILSAIARTGELFGAEHLVNVLVGETTEAVRRHRHDGLKTFGIGKDRSKGEWRSLIRQLYAAGLVSRRARRLRVVHPDGAGRRRAEGQGADRVARRRARAADAPPGQERSRRRAGVPPDDPLFLALKALRTEFAKSEGVPAYVVFTDRTLIEIAGKRPTTQSALRAIHGVGEAKLAHYGEAFLDVVRAHGGDRPPLPEGEGWGEGDPPLRSGGMTVRAPSPSGRGGPPSRLA